MTNNATIFRRKKRSLSGERLFEISERKKWSDLHLHWTDELEVVAIRVSQGGDPTTVHLVGSADYNRTQRLDAFKFIFDLAGFKIQHYPARVFRLATHF